jgi:hypothetical protein
MTTTAVAQVVPSTQNTSTVNITGSYQNVMINQSGVGFHTATVIGIGNGVSVSITQSGSINKDISINYDCAISCPASPIIVNQY